MNTSGLRAAFVVTAVTFALAGTAEALPICSGSGNCYESSTNLGLPDDTWPGAQVAATTVSFGGQPGHLATITSDAEQAFINANFSAFILGGPAGPHFGLFQSALGAEPGTPAQGASGGWQWVTGEPFYSGATNTVADVIFHNWEPSTPEPNNAGGAEDFAHFFGGASGTWNDAAGLNVLPFLVEFSPAAIPEPSTLLLMSLGLAGVYGWTRRRKYIATVRGES